MGLIAAGQQPRLVPLTGGVSSEIYRLDLDSGPVCVKRALAKLKVEKDWYAPVERNAFEVAWIEIASEIAPGAAPEIIGHDPDALMFVMAFLEPEQYPVWKEQLHSGVIDLHTAESLGVLMARLHAATAGQGAVQARFDGSAELFFALRIEPYLLATAAAQPSVATQIQQIAKTTQATSLALVHGDFSPKNILIGPNGPVILDSETANYGDPAFDLAFCLNHLLLKCVWHPEWTESYLQCFDALAAAYLHGVTWEPPKTLEARAAALLSAFLLARIDGKSPAEYITEDNDKNFVRAIAMQFLADLPVSLGAIRTTWQSKMKEKLDEDS
jgi:5-methylthioribose kinase